MDGQKAANYITGNFPRRVEIELAGACNLRCTYCPRKFLNKLNGLMTFSLYKKIIDEAAKHPDTIVVLHRRGESLLHPDFVDMCSYIKEKFKEVQLATNATVLDDIKSKAIIDAITFISFSIDVPEEFDRTRIPAKYEEVESKILRFLDLNKGRVHAQVSMVKTGQTPSDNPDIFKKIWKGKVDRVRIYEEHSKDGRFGSLEKRRAGRLPCVMPFYEMLVYYDGKVGRCNHDWSGTPMGDASKFALRDIWKNSLYKELREQHKRMTIEDELCKNCDSWYPTIGEQGTGETIE